MNWRCGGAARGPPWVVAVSKALTGVARAEAIVEVVVVVREAGWWGGCRDRMLTLSRGPRPPRSITPPPTPPRPGNATTEVSSTVMVETPVETPAESRDSGREVPSEMTASCWKR